MFNLILKGQGIISESDQSHFVLFSDNDTSIFISFEIKFLLDICPLKVQKGNIFPLQIKKNPQNTIKDKVNK